MDVTSPPSAAARAPPVKEKLESLQHRRLLRVDLAARAREHTRVLRLHDVPSCWFSGFAPAASRPLGSRTALGPCSTRQRITFPRDPSGALSARRHSSEDPGELGRLLSRGVQRVALELRHAWERPGGDPGPSTDVCSSRMLFSKTIAPRLGARRISDSHVMRELAVSRRNAHFGEPIDRARSIVRSDRVSNGVPLIPRRRGRPRRSYVR